MKIRICGSVGSGKTTLARQLSKKYHIPYYELDEVVWERHGKSGERHRSDSEIAAIIEEIVAQPHWIIEGVPNEEWTHETFKQADLLCLLNPSPAVRNYRLTRRFILQKLKLEKVHYQPTVSIYLKMFKWAKMFDVKGKPNILNLSETFEKQLFIISEPKALRQLEKKLVE